MTPERINQVIAEWVGIQTEGWWCPVCKQRVEPSFVGYNERHAIAGCSYQLESMPVPDYYHDLNAVHEAEKKLLTGACDDVRSLYLDYVMLQSEGFPDRFESQMTALTATAPQRCEALLRTLSKWEHVT